MIYCALSFIFVILFFFYHNYLFLILHIFLIFIRYKRNTKIIFILSEIMIFVFCLFRFTYFNVSDANIGYEYLVIEKYDKYAIVERDNVKYLYYEEDLDRGNKIVVIGKISLLKDSNFNNYLRSQKVNYLLEGEVISNNYYISFNDQIINKLMEGKDEENEGYLRLILFNQGKSESYFYSLFEIFSINFLPVSSFPEKNSVFKRLYSF